MAKREFVALKKKNILSQRLDIFPLKRRKKCMLCRVCSCHSQKVFDSLILKKHKVNFYHCSTCDFLQTEEPYWLEEAYAQALNQFDTGVMGRNLANTEKVAPLLYYFIGQEKQFIDYAGGWGIFVRLMRDKGFDFHIFAPKEDVFLSAYVKQGTIAPSLIVDALLKNRKLSKKEKVLHFLRKLTWSTSLPGLESKTWNDHLFLKSQNEGF